MVKFGLRQERTPVITRAAAAATSADRSRSPALDRSRLLRAMSRSKWDTSNNVLYELCSRYPAHIDDGEVLAKILLVGRVYAAAIERRRNKEDDHENDRFYTHVVAPAIISSGMDEWLHRARTAVPGTPHGTQVLVEVHGLTTSLFSEISDLEKRSLASKYLHFHVRGLFYIYDSRAVEALREFSAILPRATRTEGRGDNEYRKFAEKCNALVAYCESQFGLRPSPRQVDNLLLKVNEVGSP